MPFDGIFGNTHDLSRFFIREVPDLTQLDGRSLLMCKGLQAFLDKFLHLPELQLMIRQQLLFQSLRVRYFLGGQYLPPETVDEIVPADDKQVLHEIVEAGKFIPILPEFEENVLDGFLRLFDCLYKGQRMMEHQVMVTLDKLA